MVPMSSLLPLEYAFKFASVDSEAAFGTFARSSVPAPAYEPERWNRQDLIRDVNCLGYALNVEAWLPLIDPREFTDRRAAIAAGVRKAVSFGMLLEPSEDPAVRPGHYLVALTWGARPRNWHWLRQDADGVWSHKMGYSPITNRDPGHQLIYDPLQTAVGNGKDLIAYFHVPNEGLLLPV